MKHISKKWTVLDLFSGGGGMSYGFHAHPNFEIIGAVDAEVGKPSSKRGSLECNSTYELNMGIKPLKFDIGELLPEKLREAVTPSLAGRKLNILISCAPCTGFSRMNSENHTTDDPRNSLVRKSAEFVAEFLPDVFVMENARELIKGKFNTHYAALRLRLEELGYKVSGRIHFLSEFGLPQKRERALVIAVRDGLSLKTLEDLWDGYSIATEATSVKRAIGKLPKLFAGEKHSADEAHWSPNVTTDTLLRIRGIPKNGGSWVDLLNLPEYKNLMTPGMLRYVELNDFGSHPDVYGRMAWNKPAPTIKRECSHIGNGRYTHPEQDRLCSVREMAVLQGFPSTFKFSGSQSNMYRHIGDAVPPLISFQLAWVCEWVLTNIKPPVENIVLKDTHLSRRDLMQSAANSIQLELDALTS
jgi:DNA (cytosine-5)-methyltransferase 1